MDSPDIQRLRHIREYCRRIAATVERYGKDYDTFLSDGDYFDSVSMKIMQIGELAGGLSDEFREKTKAQMQWGAIRGMRNFFAHTYAAMDKKVIWDVAVLDIPGLLSFCDRIIERDGAEKTPSLPEEKASVMDKLKEARESPGQAAPGKKSGRNEPER